MIPVDPNVEDNGLKHYFAYGSNMDEETLLRRFKSAHKEDAKSQTNPNLSLKKIGTAT